MIRSLEKAHFGISFILHNERFFTSLARNDTNGIELLVDNEVNMGLIVRHIFSLEKIENSFGGATIAQWIHLRLPSCHPGSSVDVFEHERQVTVSLSCVAKQKYCMKLEPQSSFEAMIY